MIYIYIIFSFIFEAIFTNIFSLNSIFLPFFTITSLVVIYPFFNNKTSNFVITSIILGLLYDIVFSSSLFINTIVFGVSAFIIICFYSYAHFNVYSSIIINIIIIIFYRILSYLLLCMIEYLNFNQTVLFKGIYSSLIINIIYGILSYFLIYYIFKKHKKLNFK